MCSLVARTCMCSYPGLRMHRYLTYPELLPEQSYAVNVMSFYHAAYWCPLGCRRLLLTYMYLGRQLASRPLIPFLGPRSALSSGALSRTFAIHQDGVFMILVSAVAGKN